MPTDARGDAVLLRILDKCFATKLCTKEIDLF